MKIKDISIQADNDCYNIHMEDGTQWDLEPLDDEELEFMVYMGIGIADDADELREQAKAMICYSHVVDALTEIFPDIVAEAEDDDHELCYSFILDKDQVKALLKKYLS